MTDSPWARPPLLAGAVREEVHGPGAAPAVGGVGPRGVQRGAVPAQGGTAGDQHWDLLRDVEGARLGVPVEVRRRLILGGAEGAELAKCGPSSGRR